jgi:hypothetical protein
MSEPLRFHGAQDERNAEDFGSLREPDHVIDQRLSVDACHAKQHLRLVVNESNDAVVRREQALFASRFKVHLSSVGNELNVYASSPIGELRSRISLASAMFLLSLCRTDESSRSVQPPLLGGT